MGKARSNRTFLSVLGMDKWTGSSFETSDCRLEAPRNNPHSNYPCKLVLQGRVMVLFRHLRCNLAEIVSDTNYLVGPHLAELATCSYEYLNDLYPDVWWICIQLFFFPAKFIQLDGQFGHQATFQFNCFGDDESSVFDAFSLTCEGLMLTLKKAMKN